MTEKEEVKVVPTVAKILVAVMITTIAALNYVGGVLVELTKALIWGDTWASMLGTLIFGFWVVAIGGPRHAKTRLRSSRPLTTGPPVTAYRFFPAYDRT